MHLDRRLTALVTIGSLLLPMGALAATKKATLREMLAIVQSNVRPVEYELKMSVSNAGFFKADLQMDGRGTGNVKHLKDMKADVKFSLSAGFEDDSWSGTEKTQKLTGQLRIVDSMFYVFLDTYELTGGNDDLQGSFPEIQPYLQKWISFPMDPKEYDLGQQQGRKSTFSLGRFERFFDITTTEEKGRVRYHITLPEAKKRGLIQAISNQSRAYTKQRMGAKTRKALNSILLNIDVTIEALTDKTFESGKAGFNFQMTADGKPLKTSFEVSTDVSLFQATIVAPQNSTPWERLQGEIEIDKLDEFDEPDMQRRADINTILNANYQYNIDNNGKFIAGLVKGSVLQICKTKAQCDGVSLDVLHHNYIVSTPVDPEQNTSSPFSGYTIEWLSNGRLRVSAPMAKSQSMSVTR